MEHERSTSTFPGSPSRVNPRFSDTIGPAMKVRTGAKPFPLLLNLCFGLFCLGGAIWGAYDYWVAYPAIEQRHVAYQAAKEVDAEIQKLTASRAATPEEVRRLTEARETIARLEREAGGVPQQLAAWDRPLQLWLWVIGCGVLGVPFFVWPIARMLSRRWELSEDGTLRTPKETIPIDAVEGIDMSRWCSPTGSKRSTWKAWLVTKDGRRHELDDHDYARMHLIIGFYAHRFHPDEWTEIAKRVKAPDADAAAQPAKVDDPVAAQPES